MTLGFVFSYLNIFARTNAEPWTWSIYSKGGRSLRDESRLRTDGGPELPGPSGGFPRVASGQQWSVTRGAGHRSHRTERGLERYKQYYYLAMEYHES